MTDTSITSDSQRQDPKSNASPSPGMGQIGPPPRVDARNAVEATRLRERPVDPEEVKEAYANAQATRIRAQEAERRAIDAGKAPQQLAAEQAAREADDALARAAEVDRQNTRVGVRLSRDIYVQPERVTEYLRAGWRVA